MKIVSIPVAAIAAGGRARPVTDKVAEQLAEDIRARGLRQPIEVERTGPGAWRLVAGAHRLAACRLLHHDAIAAVEVTGSEPELRRDELLENLSRNELSKLERAQSLAELRRVYQEIHPETREHVAGGHAKAAGANLAVAGANLAPAWSEAVAVRAAWAARTIERAAWIGERLAPEAVSRLRGTPIEDNQRELEALAKLPPDTQAQVAELMTRGRDAAPSVAAALDIIEGRTARPADAIERAFSGLIDRYNRAPKEVRRRFVLSLPEAELEEFIAARGYRLARGMEAA